MTPYLNATIWTLYDANRAQPHPLRVVAISRGALARILDEGKNFQPTNTPSSGEPCATIGGIKVLGLPRLPYHPDTIEIFDLDGKRIAISFDPKLARAQVKMP